MGKAPLTSEMGKASLVPDKIETQGGEQPKQRADVQCVPTDLHIFECKW